MPRIRIVTASELSSQSLLARDYIEEAHGKNIQHEVAGRRLGEAVEACPQVTTRGRGLRRAQSSTAAGKPSAKAKG